MYRACYFCKPDLDTVTAAFLLYPSCTTTLHHLLSSAPEEILADPTCLCLECGGSGRREEGNFDHHGDTILPCATYQAWEFTGSERKLRELVDYVSCVDTGKAIALPPNGLPLSAVFSGMLLCTRGPKEQFCAGLRLIEIVVATGISPLDISKLIVSDKNIAQYAHAKKEATEQLEACIPLIKRFVIKGRVVMTLSVPLAGVHGLLRRLGADISIAGSAGRWTIAVKSGKEQDIHSLSLSLSQREPGWGGPAGGGIIGSPRSKPSSLNLDELLALLKVAL